LPLKIFFLLVARAAKHLLSIILLWLAVAAAVAIMAARERLRADAVQAAAAQVVLEPAHLLPL